MFHKHSKVSVLWYLALLHVMHAAESNTENQDGPNHGTESYVLYSNRTDEPVKYPNNRKIERAQVERFKEYYKCLDKFKMTPAVHYVLPGTSLSLHCDACISPQGNSVQWQYANKATNFTLKVLISDTVVNKHSQTIWSTQTEDGRTLNLYGLSLEESGHYNCIQDGNVITPHLVQVGNSTENVSKVYSETAPTGPYPSSPFNLTELGVKIWFQWNDWSECSHCDQVGKRMRIGICMVTSFETNNSTEAKILKIFPKGIPCRSNVLPTSIKNHSRILSTNNEYMVEFCKETCLKNKKYVLRETGGILLKKMAGLSDPFTFIKRLPHISPPIKHSALYLNQWETAHIQCPGSDYNNAPIHWRLGLNLLLTENERVHFGPTGILFIKNLRMADSNVYSCWQRNRIVGIVRLMVSQPIRLSFEEQLNVIVLVAIIISFLIITLRIIRAYLKRRRLAKRTKK